MSVSVVVDNNNLALISHNYFNEWLLRRSLERDDGGPGCSNGWRLVVYTNSKQQCFMNEWDQQ